MRTSAGLVFLGLMLASLETGCSRFGAVYPPRPPATPGEPVNDPAPSRVVAHLAVTSTALKAALDDSIPKTGDGSFRLAGERRYAWDRQAVDLGFSQGRIVIDAKVHANLSMPVGSLDFPLDLHVVAEPVINTEYQVKLQSTEVKVTSNDRRLAAADYVAGVYGTISTQINEKLKTFSYDLSPLVKEAHARIAKPVEFPVGDAHGCAELDVLGIEAGPTVIADGIEKDIALIVAPSVSIPCSASTKAKAVPSLANVATITPGPFTVTVPIAAQYGELQKAMGQLFTDGKYFFSPEYPGLYLENPELYESQGKLVLKLHIAGPIHKLGIDTDLDGDLFLSGHPTVVDNEVAILDLEPTIETSNLLLSIKAMKDGDTIRDQARAALRLDVGQRLRAIREQLSTELTFGVSNGCFQGAVDKVEVTGVHTHGTYLRVYVAVTGRASASMPCPAGVLPTTPPVAAK